MPDNLRDRIAAAAAGYLKDSGAYFDHYTDDNSTVDGDISLLDMADAVIEALPDYLWRCPKCSKGYWADHGPICNVTPPPWGSGR